MPARTAPSAPRFTAPPAAPTISRRPDDGLTRPLVSDRYCRAVVVLPGGNRITLSLPARVPLLEVADLVVRDVPLGDVMLPPVWTLGEVGRPAIPPMATLADAGVLDGAVLEVRDVAADEVGEAMVLDIAEMVSDAEDDDGHGRWTPAAAARTVERVGYVSAVVAALAGLSVPARDHSRAVIGLATVVVGLVVLAAANLRHRGHRTSRVDAVLAAWCAVAVLGVATRYSTNAADLVPRVGTGVALAALLACAAVPVLAVIGPALVLGVAAVTTAALAGTGAVAVESAAVAGTLGALLVTLAPALAGRLGALVPDTAGPGAGSDEVAPGVRLPATRRSAAQARWERSMRARIALAVGQVHVVFVTACVVGAAAVVAAEFELARAASVYPAVLSAVLAVVVLLRVVPARRDLDGAVLLIGGVAATLVVLAVLPGRWWPVWVGPVLALGVVVIGVAAGLTTINSGPPDAAGPVPDPAMTEAGLMRAARITSVLLLVVAVVLTAGCFEVFEHFWHVGRSL